METGHSGRRNATSDGDLTVAAFGSDAGSVTGADAVAACSPQGRAWLHAVALAGRGRFAGARVAAGSVRSGPFYSAARCLEASMLRQTGRHREAAAGDGKAFAHAIALPDDPELTLVAAFRVDAAVGLAADALGTGRFALCARMLDRADLILDRRPVAERGGAFDSPPRTSAIGIPWWTIPRARLRRDWVAAELAIYSGDITGAKRAADALLRAAPGRSRPRHHAKTTLIAAAAMAAAGDLEQAAQTASRAHTVARETGLDPLQWAGAKLMTGLSAGSHSESFACDAAAVEAKWIRDGAEFERL